MGVSQDPLSSEKLCFLVRCCLQTAGKRLSPGTAELYLPHRAMRRQQTWKCNPLTGTQQEKPCLPATITQTDRSKSRQHIATSPKLGVGPPPLIRTQSTEHVKALDWGVGGSTVGLCLRFLPREAPSVSYYKPIFSPFLVTTKEGSPKIPHLFGIEILPWLSSHSLQGNSGPLMLTP